MTDSRQLSLEALKQTAQALAWSAHGECRGYHDIAAKVEPEYPDWYQDPQNENWLECADDACILESIDPEGEFVVGSEYELDVCWNGKQRFRVTKIADDDSDDIEVECIGGTQFFASPQQAESVKMEPWFDYFVLQRFALENDVSFNELCAAVRESVIYTTAPQQAEAAPRTAP